MTTGKTDFSFDDSSRSVNHIVRFQADRTFSPHTVSGCAKERSEVVLRHIGVDASVLDGDK